MLYLRDHDLDKKVFNLIQKGLKKELKEKADNYSACNPSKILDALHIVEANNIAFNSKEGVICGAYDQQMGAPVNTGSFIFLGKSVEEVGVILDGVKPRVKKVKPSESALVKKVYGILQDMHEMEKNHNTAMEYRSARVNLNTDFSEFRKVEDFEKWIANVVRVSKDQYFYVKGWNPFIRKYEYIRQQDFLNDEIVRQAAVLFAANLVNEA